MMIARQIFGKKNDGRNLGQISQNRARNYNPGQNIWNKIEKSSKTGQVKKILISTSACFLTAIAKVSFLVGRIGTKLYLHLNLRFS